MLSTIQNIIDVLRETDEEHPLTQGEIARRIKKENGKSLDRKTVNGAFREIRKNPFGGIRIVEAAKRGYYLDDILFGYDEAKLIGRAIMKSGEFTRSEKRELIEKLASLFPTYKRDELISEARKVPASSSATSFVSLMDDLRFTILGKSPITVTMKDLTRRDVFPRGIAYDGNIDDYVLTGNDVRKEAVHLPIGQIAMFIQLDTSEFTKAERTIVTDEGPFFIEEDGRLYCSFTEKLPTRAEAELAYRELLPFMVRNGSLINGRQVELTPPSFEKILAGKGLIHAFIRGATRHDREAIGPHLRKDAMVLLSYALLNGDIPKDKMEAYEILYIEASSPNMELSKAGYSFLKPDYLAKVVNFLPNRITRQNASDFPMDAGKFASFAAEAIKISRLPPSRFLIEVYSRLPKEEMRECLPSLEKLVEAYFAIDARYGRTGGRMGNRFWNRFLDEMSLTLKGKVEGERLEEFADATSVMTAVKGLLGFAEG